jgi:BirA family transcriptional regulator, biotin operon repressor / biotin---[acetyl-CoA-carboxylase] ligase
MDQVILDLALKDLPLPATRYLARTGSTNDDAARWAEEGAADLALVMADEQTAGRGRAGRIWHTLPDTALAFSLVLRPQPNGGSLDSARGIAHVTALGSLAICDTLRNKFGLFAEIKWPNDVLVSGEKVAGVLTEAYWQGDQLNAVILGAGVNITANAIPRNAPLNFPATDLETQVGRPVDRLDLLHAILSSLVRWKNHLYSDLFLSSWNANLAYKGQPIVVLQDDQSLTGMLVGVNPDGSLQLALSDGTTRMVLYGDVQLRLVDDFQE